MIDNGRRLLFLSNFDGSWENYLDDFIDKASIGLTGVWSNTLKFPRTYFLVLGGASDGSPNGASNPEACDRMGAKFVGRWKSGAPTGPVSKIR